MNLKRINLIIVVIFFFIVGIIALPKFSFQIGENIISLPNIDLGLISPGSTLGNFRRGEGLYPQNEVFVTLDLEAYSDPEIKKQKFEEFLKVVQKRIDYAGLLQIRVRGEFEDNYYRVHFTAPDYLGNLRNLVELLTAKGVMNFQTSADTQLENIQAGKTDNTIYISPADIEGVIHLDYIESINQFPVGNHLVFAFKQSRAADFEKTLSDNSNFFILNIDGVQAFTLIRHDAQTLSVRAIPNNLFNSTADKLIYLNIVQTYFLEESALNIAVTIDGNTTQTPAMFGSEGRVFIAAMFIFSAAAMYLGVLFKNGLKNAAKFAGLLGSAMLTLVVLLKIPAASLSIYTLVGVLVAYMIFVVNSFTILRSSYELLEKRLFRFRNLGLVLVIFSAVIFQLTNLYWVYEFSGVILSTGLTLLLMNAYNFRVIRLALTKEN